jgi:hypothetical protein
VKDENMRNGEKNEENTNSLREAIRRILEVEELAEGWRQSFAKRIGR